MLLCRPARHRIQPGPTAGTPPQSQPIPPISPIPQPAPIQRAATGRKLFFQAATSNLKTRYVRFYTPKSRVFQDSCSFLGPRRILRITEQLSRRRQPPLNTRPGTQTTNTQINPFPTQPKPPAMPLEPLTGFPKPPAPARMPNRPGDVPSGNHEHMSAGARLRPTPKKTWDTCEGRTVVVLPPSVVSAPWAVPGHKLAFIQTREGRIAVLLLETRFEQATAQASPGRNSMRPRPFGRGNKNEVIPEERNHSSMGPGCVPGHRLGNLRLLHIDTTVNPLDDIFTM